MNDYSVRVVSIAIMPGERESPGHNADIFAD